jgi:2,3-dihydroxy-p-cumate/2,3-dihydroxybenzoate 3,4-dioxygenase
MSLLVDHLGYVALGTPDVEHAVDFFVGICQLEVSERRDGVVFLRGGTEHHWLRIEHRDEPGVIRAGFQATDSESAAEVKRRVEARGIETRPGGTLKEDRVVDAYRFTEINGIEIEIFREMVMMPMEPQPTGVDVRIMLHAVYMVDDIVATMEFWHDVVDFRRSDQIEDLAVFMRCGNQFHHSIGFLRGEQRAGKLDHFCMLVEHIDDVMLMLNAGKRSGMPMQHDLVRHAASGSIGTYLEYEPLELGVEYCTGHGTLEDEHPGRLLLASPVTVNLWNAVPPRAVEHTNGEALSTGTRGILVENN